MNSYAKIAAAILACLACLIFNMMAWSAWNPTYILNDGVQYLSTAQNWLAGNGLSTNSLMYKPHFQGAFPGPQTVWPPGYPLVVALASVFGADLQTTGVFVNLFFLALSAVITMAILVRCHVKVSSAFFYALIFYLTAVSWHYAMGMLTEPLFTALILATILLLPDPEQDRIWPWFVCGVLLALCVSVRYSGVFFAMGLGFGLFVYIAIVFRRDAKRFFRSVGLLTMLLSISVACFLALRYRAYLLTGTFSRETGYVEPGTFSETIMQIAWQTRRMLGFIEGGIQSSLAIKIMSALFILLTAYVVLQSIYVVLKTVNKVEHSGSRRRRITCAVVIGHSVVFVVYFSIASAVTSTVSVNDRYIYQIYSGLFVLFCLLVFEALKGLQILNNSGLFNWYRGSLVALLCLFLATQVNHIAVTNQYSKQGRHSLEALALPVAENFTVREMIESCFSNSDKTKGALWSNDSQLLYLNTSIPTITTAEGYTEEHNGLDVIEQQIETYGVRMFLFLNGMFPIPVEHEELMARIKNWLVESGHEKVSLLEHRISDGITVEAYIVDHTCQTSI